MRLGTKGLLLVSLVVAVAITIISGIQVRWLWSSPGGSAYGIGLPQAYSAKYCGGYAPCYWTSVYPADVLEDILFWFAFAAGVLYMLNRRS